MYFQRPCLEARLVDGEVVAVPRVDAGLAQVHHRHADVRALERNHRHGGAADIAGADAADCARWEPMEWEREWAAGGRGGRSRQSRRCGVERV